MLIISSREFRQKQKSYFEKVDKGEEVIIRRGRDKSYKLLPVSSDDTLMSKEDFFAMIEKAQEAAKKGKLITMPEDADVKDFINELCTE